MNLFGPMHLAKREDIISSRFDIERQLGTFCGSSSTLFCAFVLSCAACYMYFFFLENIEFDNTDYTRCLAVSIFTAFKIQKSVSLEGMHNRRKRLISICANEDRDRVNLKFALFF